MTLSCLLIRITFEDASSVQWIYVLDHKTMMTVGLCVFLAQLSLPARVVVRIKGRHGVLRRYKSDRMLEYKSLVKEHQGKGNIIPITAEYPSIKHKFLRAGTCHFLLLLLYKAVFLKQCIMTPRVWAGVGGLQTAGKWANNIFKKYYWSALLPECFELWQLHRITEC